ncbi:hypothetical protein VNO80_22051 [Phaseolus coccineus]|uniref:Uncharacterized protein n=1 Tax=Phaseolus coccineus TaxID=3886 RepID=A0AAN9M4D7_PHACN
MRGGPRLGGRPVIAQICNIRLHWKEITIHRQRVCYTLNKLQPVAREVHMGCPMITEACWSDERGCRHGGAIPISLVSDWLR